jgi:hypothetical protein
MWLGKHVDYITTTTMVMMITNEAARQAVSGKMLVKYKNLIEQHI